MFSAVLKTIKAGKKSEDTIEFNSSELKENNFVWDFLNSQIELLDGSLREVVIDLHNGRTRTLEFAGGTITVPSNLNCDINLYNHFKEYFQVDYKIPMFLFQKFGMKTYTKHLVSIRCLKLQSLNRLLHTNRWFVMERNRMPATTGCRSG